LSNPKQGTSNEQKEIINSRSSVMPTKTNEPKGVFNSRLSVMPANTRDLQSFWDDGQETSESAEIVGSTEGLIQTFGGEVEAGGNDNCVGIGRDFAQECKHAKQEFKQKVVTKDGSSGNKIGMF
jgi:hypothetical protein